MKKIYCYSLIIIIIIISLNSKIVLSEKDDAIVIQGVEDEIIESIY